MGSDRLQVERETFQRLLPSLLADEGKYALVIGDKLIGTFASYEEALSAGYERAKLDPFLVKRISGVETVAYFSRDTSPSCLTTAS